MFLEYCSFNCKPIVKYITTAESELQFEETTDQIESGSPAILSEESVAYLYSVLRFENNSYIFSIDAKLDTASQEENGLCVILFVNPNAEIVLASEVVRLVPHAVHNYTHSCSFRLIQTVTVCRLCVISYNYVKTCPAYSHIQYQNRLYMVS